MLNLNKLSLGRRLSLFQALVIFVGMSIFSLALTGFITKRLNQRTEHELEQQAMVQVNLMASYDSALTDSAGKLAQVFRASFTGAITLDPARTISTGGKEIPILTAGGAVINLNTAQVDQFTALTKAAGTVFVRSGADFIRIATSLKKEDGSRAVGTALDRAHPAYQGLLQGEEFVGKATLFGKDYMTKYLPVRDAGGKVIAVFFIGLDFTDGLKSLREEIKTIKVGQSGYVYALDARDGVDNGKLQIHPVKEGTNIAGAKDTDGREFIREMLKQKEGSIRYSWVNKELGETAPREKLVVFRHLKPWNWLICVGAA